MFFFIFIILQHYVLIIFIFSPVHYTSDTGSLDYTIGKITNTPNKSRAPLPEHHSIYTPYIHQITRKAHGVILKLLIKIWTVYNVILLTLVSFWTLISIDA